MGTTLVGNLTKTWKEPPIGCPQGNGGVTMPFFYPSAPDTNAVVIAIHENIQVNNKEILHIM